MNSVIERINKKCKEAKKKLILTNWHRKIGKKTEDTYVQPISSSRKIT